jgi:DNA-binding FadR family transcriptional regulator
MYKLKPVSKFNLTKYVEEEVLNYINNNKLSPGDKLPSSSSLSKQLKVSIGTIRSALKKLENIGLLVLKQGEFPKISEPSIALSIDNLTIISKQILINSRSSLDDLKSFRLLLETEIVLIATDKATPDDTSRLYELVELQKESTSKSEYIKCDKNFHIKLAEITQNIIYPQIISAIFNLLGDFYADHIYNTSDKNYHKITIHDHKQIVKAVESKNTDDAKEKIILHLNKANYKYTN